MYLKQIEIIGFKSFAKRTQIDFTGNITAVVGPNGSGKSNIADAIKWVLGEQRTKSLRGEKMEDVIFNGTVEKRPLGYAQVSLLLDNSKKILPVEYEEVSVTRRLYRSGESQYFINKTLCRLKDIQQLFMDTGLGKEGYSIVGQGQVQDLVDGNPQSRRLLLEEAVGIVKYKTKKIEAERKLENTQKNLDRAQDIIAELQKRIGPLKYQMEKAKRYLRLRDQLKERELNIFAHKIEEFDREYQKCAEDKEIMQQNYDMLEEKFVHAEKQYLSLREIVAVLEEQINTLNAQIYQAQSQHEDSKTNREVARIKYEQNKAQIELLKQEEKIADQRIEELENEKNEIEALLTLQEEEHRILEQKVEEQKREAEKSQSRQNEFVSKESEYQNILYVLRECEQNIQNQEQQLKEARDVQAKNAQQWQTLTQQLSETQQRYNEWRNQAETAQQQHEEAQRQMNEMLQKMKVSQSQLSMLQTSEEDRQGYGYGVKKLLEAKERRQEIKDDVHGVLAELIQIEPKYLKAVTAALGGAFRYVVVENENTAAACIELLNKNKWGRVTFMPLSVIKPSCISDAEKDSLPKEYLQVACNVVNYDARFEGIVKNVLGRVLITEDMQQAIRLSKMTKQKWKIVTLNGEVFLPGGTIVGGEVKTDNVAPLERKQRIKDLAVEVDKLQKGYDNAVMDAARAKSEMEKAQSELQMMQTKLNEVSIEEGACKRQKSLLEETSRNIEQQLNNTYQKNLEYTERKKSVEAFFDIHSDMEGIKNEYRTNWEQLNQATIEAVKVLEKKNYTKERLRQITSDLAEKQQMQTVNARRYQEAHGLEEELLESMENYRQQSERHSAEREAMKAEYDSILLQKAEKSGAYEQINAEVIALSKEKNSLNDAMHRLELRLNNAKMKIDHLSENIVEQYEIDISEPQQYKNPVENMALYIAQTEEIKGKIKSMGTIHIGALEEYNEVVERYEFLTMQKEDLLNAKADVENVIADIEKNMTLQFQEQFAVIQREFQIAFSKLFKGGKASLTILDEEDLLGTGVDISAQPPGKKLKNISMLSGGEKALTAIALLFAILKIKPSPFCVFDEIDAALDDQNVDHFSSYLNEIRDQNQFILITHKKRTMEICDSLYGASMGRDGTTTVVSLQLKDKGEHHV